LQIQDQGQDLPTNICRSEISYVTRPKSPVVYSPLLYYTSLVAEFQGTYAYRWYSKIGECICLCVCGSVYKIAQKVWNQFSIKSVIIAAQLKEEIHNSMQHMPVASCVRLIA